MNVTKTIIHVEHALGAFDGSDGFSHYTSEEISALITGLAHYSEHRGYNLQEIIRIAALNYEAERTNQQSGTTGGESSDSPTA